MQPVEFEIKLSITVSESGVITPVTKIFVDSEQIGFVNKLRIDLDSDDFLPAISMDMLRGLQPDLVDPSVKTEAEGYFKLLSRVPGLKCTLFASKKK
jgi:hypothetical protein